MTNYTPESIFYDANNGVSCPISLREVVEQVKEYWSDEEDNNEKFWFDEKGKGFSSSEIWDLWNAIHPTRYVAVDQEHWFTARKGE